MELPTDVFVVEHLHVHDDGEEDAKLIGIYSTRTAAEKAVERLKLKPGFRDTPEGFTIDLYRLDEDHWTEGFVTVRHRMLETEEKQEEDDEPKQPNDTST
jgi:hypothetical protein